MPTTPTTLSASTRRVVVAVLALLLLAGCGRPFPADPNDSLQTITDRGTLRVGASHHPPQVVHDGERVTGSEVDLVEDYAEHLGVRIEWTMNSETALIDGLETGELDLVIAGLRDDSQWSGRAGLTRPHAEETAADGTRVNRVIAVPMGENALLGDLERWLDGRSGSGR